MNRLADDFAGLGVGSYFLYTGEAHPGENFPPLESMQQKLAHARALRDKRGITREIVVDALDGACHQYFGGLPNMTWIFGQAGGVLYKSDWTDVASVRNAVEYLLAVRERRKAGEKLVPIRVERLDYRHRDREEFYRVLEVCGPQAVKDFNDTFGPDWAT